MEFLFVTAISCYPAAYRTSCISNEPNIQYPTKYVSEPTLPNKYYTLRWISQLINKMSLQKGKYDNVQREKKNKANNFLKSAQNF